jgi:aspartate aminotransferase-like enzyme
VRLALDAARAVGCVPVDLRGVYLASATSGKGLGSFAGLSMVFHDRPAAPAPDALPRYVDLGLLAAGDGVPFTQSSNLLGALRIALERRDWPSWLDQVARDGAALRARLRRAGLRVVAPESHAAPAVATIALPSHVDSIAVGLAMARDGFLVSYESGHLRRRNWVQLCLMGDYPRDAIADAVDRLAAHAVLGPSRSVADVGLASAR